MGGLDAAIAECMFTMLYCPVVSLTRHQISSLPTGLHVFSSSWRESERGTAPVDVSGPCPHAAG
jgi:hypothetical protein